MEHAQLAAQALGFAVQGLEAGGCAHEAPARHAWAPLLAPEGRGDSLGVAVVAAASGRHLGAADPPVHGGVAPLDFCVVSHGPPPAPRTPARASP